MKRLVAALLAATTLSGLFVAGGSLTASAEDPTFVSWTGLLPAISTTYDPGSENECTSGKISCVDKVVKEMTKRFGPLGTACDHNAVFSLAYLRTTQTYRWASETPGFFEDPAFVNHEDAVFASYYFQAYDNWAKGNRADVPKAWLVTFDAAKNRTVTGSGDVFLGMGAHVNRDLPFVLAGIGLVKPDGTSRKPDHDAVNKFLNAVVDPLLSEVATRFDPGADDAALPLKLGYTSSFQMLAAWRESAWRNAERLAAAPDAASYAQVAQSIEDYAATTNQLLAAASAPSPLSPNRDLYCAAHKGDQPPAYAFGTPTAW